MTLRLTKKKPTIEECPDCPWYNKATKLCAFNYDGESHGTFEEYADECPDDVELVDNCWCFYMRED